MRGGVGRLWLELALTCDCADGKTRAVGQQWGVLPLTLFSRLHGTCPRQEAMVDTCKIHDPAQTEKPLKGKAERSGPRLTSG